MSFRIIMQKIWKPYTSFKLEELTTFLKDKENDPTHEDVNSEHLEVEIEMDIYTRADGTKEDICM